jgi:phosphatidylglycerophosphate synthase
MIDGPFRQKLPNFTGPLIRLYKVARLTPNMISITSVFIAALAAALCAYDHPLLALLTWWLGRLLDGTDGIYARATGQSSDFGAYLDIVCDMAAYSLMIFGFLHLHPQLNLTWASILFLYVLCIASALALGSLEEKRQIITQDNRGLRLGAGLAEGGETGLAYSVFLVFPSAIETLTIIWIIILSATIVARTLLARRLLF